ncbi:hypothetical protein AT246_06990 [Bartonella henselae]|nr:hypothetical protein AT238_07515 [Bartonella henselae]OLL57968.1 hypothetical protein AT246_06990 [Bartonella henselae]
MYTSYETKSHLPPGKQSSRLFLFLATFSFFQGEILFNQPKEQSHNLNKNYDTASFPQRAHSLKKQIFFAM